MSVRNIMHQNTVKKIPERKCLGCNEKKPKKQLIRIVRTPEGEVVLDTTGKRSGRGAYICPDSKCLAKAVKSKRLENVFETAVPESVYAELEKYLSEVADHEV